MTLLRPEPLLVAQVLERGTLVVPDYQRPFSWTDAEALEMIDDINSYIGSKESLYLGQIILMSQGEEPRGNSPCLQIVDGQQRLTVIQLLLIALRMHVLALGDKKFSDLIQKQIFFTNNLGDNIGFHLRPSPKIIPLFDLMASEDWGGEFPEKIDYDGVIRGVKIPRRRIKPIYDFFLKSLRDKKPSLDEAKAFFDKLINGTYFSVIFVSDEVEALKIFERTNSRGMALESSDLIKNFLFQDSEQAIRENWNQMESCLEPSVSIARLARGFFTSAYGHVLKKDLFRELKRRVTEKIVTPTELSERMATYAKFWSAARGSSSDWKDYLAAHGRDFNYFGYEFSSDSYSSLSALRCFGFAQHYPLVFSAINALPPAEGRAGIRAEYECCAKLIRALESFHFVSNVVAGNPTNQVEHLFAHSCTTAGNPTYDEWVNELIAQLRILLPGEMSFLDAWPEQTSYEEGGKNTLVLYVLDRLSNFGKMTGVRQSIFNSGVKGGPFSIEHFLSQKQASEMGIAREDIHKMGNLIPIPNSLNSVFGAKAPQEKAKIAGPGGPEHRNLGVGLAAELFGSLPAGFEWGTKEIVERTVALGEHAYRKVWAL